MKKSKIVVNHTDLYNNGNNLFVLIGANRLSCFITSPQKEVIMQSIECFEHEVLASFFENERYFELEFNMVKVGFITPYSTLVPNIIFQENEAATYLKNSFRIPHHHYLLTNNLPSFQCQNVFLAPVEVYNFLQNKFTNIEFFHAGTPLLLNWQQKAVQLQTASIFINVIDKQFQIAAFQQEKLLLFNTFEFKSTKDLLHFISF
jgi:hypothetical protein